MENKFGVKLKSTGAGKPTDRNFKPSKGSSSGSMTRKTSSTGPPPKFTDIKARFDDAEKADETGKKTSGSPGTRRKMEFGTDYSAKSVNGGTARIKLGVTSKTKKTDVGDKSSFQRSVPSRGSFERKVKLDDAGGKGSKDEDDGAQIVVGKVFTRLSNNAHTATVENRLQRSESNDDPVDKVTASNLLTGQLAMLRIRPGSGGKKEERTTSSSRTVEKTNNSFKKIESTTTRTTNVGAKPVITSSTNSSIGGSLKFGKTLSSSSSAPVEFGLSFASKKREEYKAKDLSKTVTSLSRQSSSDSVGSSTNSPRSNISADVVQLDMDSVSKLDSVLGIRKLESRGNRIETKTVTKTVESARKRPGSPRTIVTETKVVTTSVSKKPGVSKTMSSHEEVTTFSTSKSECQTESRTARTWGGNKIDIPKMEIEDGKPEWLDKSKEMINKFQTKLKPTTVDVPCDKRKDTSSAAVISTSKTPFVKPADKKLTDLMTSKTNSVNKPAKTDINSNKMALPYRVTASSVDRSQRSSDLSDTGSDVSTRSSSSLPSVLDKLPKRHVTTRKMDPDHFRKIKGNFEDKSRSGSSTPERSISDPKMEFKKPESRVKNIVLERKNSFECFPSPPASPRDATQQVLKETGPIPNVKKFAKEINSGRVRAFSTGSIRDSGSDHEYDDAVSRRREWPSSDDDSEALYEFIKDPGLAANKEGTPRKNRNMSRRPCLKR